MITNPVGWLPYGSSDESVLFYNTLTSEAGMASIPAVTVTKLGSTTVFDSELGMNAGSNGGYQIDRLTGYAGLDAGGQISIEVQNPWPLYNDTAAGSIGVALGTTMGLVSASSSGAVPIWLIMRDGSNSLRSCPAGVTASMNRYIDNIPNVPAGGVSTYVHSEGKGEFTQINVGWSGGPNGGIITLAVDGHCIGSAVRSSTISAAMFYNLWIGNLVNNYRCNGYYIRNLQVSNRPPMFAVHPLLDKICVLSDSLFGDDATTYGDNVASSYRDVVGAHSLRRYLANRGLYAGNIYVSRNSGYTVDSALGTALSTQIAAILALHPRKVFYRGGTNDAANTSFNSANFDTAIKADMTTLLADSGVENVVVGTIPSLKYNSTYDTAAVVARTVAANAVINALSAWDSRVVVADVFTATGGESPYSNVFVGQLNGLSNNFHLAGAGHRLEGNTYAEAIIRTLG